MKELLHTLFSFILICLTLNVSRADTEVSCVVMETCTLPCSFHGHTDAVIHWIYTAGDLHVYSYYNNQDQLVNQAPRFRGKASLFQDQISGGNASLQLTEVQVQDQGTYKCFTSTISGNKNSFINLKVNVPITKIHIEQVGNRMICSSEGIYPEPGLTWSTNPPSNTTFNSKTTVQQTEQLLYNISSSLILSDEDPDVDVSCTISTSRNSRTATLRKLGECYISQGRTPETPSYSITLIFVTDDGGRIQMHSVGSVKIRSLISKVRQAEAIHVVVANRIRQGAGRGEVKVRVKVNFGNDDGTGLS